MQHDSWGFDREGDSRPAPPFAATALAMIDWPSNNDIAAIQPSSPVPNVERSLLRGCESDLQPDRADRYPPTNPRDNAVARDTRRCIGRPDIGPAQCNGAAVPASSFPPVHLAFERNRGQFHRTSNNPSR